MSYQQTDSQNYGFSYGYDLAGEMITEVLIILLVLLAQETYPQAAVSSYNIPSSVDKGIKALHGNYVISGRINPFYLRGDFDGDGKPDFAVLISDKNQNGIAICRSGSLTTIVLGAGTEFHKMKDLHFDAWQVYPKSPVKRGVGEGRPPTLLSEAILLTWEESASALIYWNGKRFVWYQQGD